MHCPLHDAVHLPLSHYRRCSNPAVRTVLGSSAYYTEPSCDRDEKAAPLRPLVAYKNSDYDFIPRDPVAQGDHLDLWKMTAAW
jgi:hypothetical protein